MEPIFERRFSNASFACRVGKGTHAAVKQAQQGARKFAYVLKCDVRKYFASIDHDILKYLLGRVVKCSPTLDLAARIIDGSDNRQQETRRPTFPAMTCSRRTNAAAVCRWEIKPRNSSPTST